MMIKAGLLLVFLFLLPIQALAEATIKHWQPVSDKSIIEWSANYAGKAVAGSFSIFTSDIKFDPDNLSKSSVNVAIETAKVKTSDKNAMENLPTGEWFASRKYPMAVFKSDLVRHIKDNNYEAEGTLTIRDKTLKIILPFTVNIVASHAIMNCETKINRLDYGVGQGDWAKTDVVSGDVKISIHIEANSY